MNDKELIARTEEENSEAQMNIDSQLNNQSADISTDAEATEKESTEALDSSASAENEAEGEDAISEPSVSEENADAATDQSVGNEAKNAVTEQSVASLETAVIDAGTEGDSESVDFVSLFSAQNSEEEPEDVEPTSDDEESLDDADRIVPPDELFAYMAKEEKAEEDEESEQESDEQSPEDEEFYDDENDEDNVDVDGQYHFSDLELAKEYSTKSDYEESKQAKYDPKKPRRIDSLFDFVELFVFTLIAVMLLTSFVFKHSIVSGSSMENTLDNGDHLIITDFFYTPERGDIIVCDYRENTIKYPVVKRVIGVPGDIVEVKVVNSQYLVYVNGRQLDEPYVKIDMSGEFTAQAPIRIPDGMYFVMGDNRNKSADSRNPMSLGLIPEESVLGKVLLRIYPFDKFGTVEQGIKYVE